MPRISLTWALGLIAAFVAQARADDKPAQPDQKPAPTAQAALQRALDFIQNDAVKWREEHRCASCHHGAMTVWVQSEASKLGHAVTAEALDESADWAKETFMPMVDRPYDPRPGYRMVGLGPVYLALADQLGRRPGSLSPDERKRIAAHIVTHQEADGSFEPPPAQNGPPPVFESRETMTLWACLALGPFAAGQEKEATPEAQASLQKAAAWLESHTPSDTTQVVALRLLIAVRRGETGKNIEAHISRLLGRQNADGGWSPVPGAPSDAYATGQALYVLGGTGTDMARPEVERAVAFLVATQREDGSWPMKSRGQPGAKPFTNPVPITYFGAAWGTLGLLRALPAPVAP